MYFDALTLAAVTDELRTTILDGRVQRVRLPSALSVALEIYNGGRRHNLLLSAHPQLVRVQLTASKPTRGVERDTPLLLLLRKYVAGGRVIAIDQPDLERVIVLSIAKGPAMRNTQLDPAETDEDAADAPAEGELWQTQLVVETIERRANIVLVGDDALILESARHITADMSRRQILPRLPYELPPGQLKLDPRAATPEQLAALAASDPPTQAGSLARALVSAYRGLSPQAAREVVFRTTASAETPLAATIAWDTLAAALRALWNAPWQPSLGWRHEQLAAYAPYQLTHLPRYEAQPSISAALDAFYGQRERLGAHQQRKEQLLAELDVVRQRLERQRQQLEGELEQVQRLEQLRWEGEMILGFMHAITAGATELVVENQAIALNPALTPLENAQERFRAYDKAKGALANVPDRIRQTTLRLEGLEQTVALLVLADSYEQIAEISREASEQGYLRTSGGVARKGRRQPPLRLRSSDGFSIYIGRSAGQNEHVTFSVASADDLWLHARGIPGSHVIIKRDGREVPERTIREAAEIAAFHSRARDDTHVEVDIAHRRLVRRAPDGPLGLVTYRAEQTVRVAPRAPGNQPQS